MHRIGLNALPEIGLFVNWPLGSVQPRKYFNMVLIFVFSAGNSLCIIELTCV